MHHAASASVLLATALSLATPALAQQAAKEFPGRPIRLVIPQTAGSATDTMTRVLAVKWSELLGQQLVIDNRTGVGGLIGAGIVAHADPDGYTLLCASTPSQIIGPQLYAKSITYEPLKGFTAIGQFAVTQNVLITTLKAPFKDVKELIAHAKENPGKINWGNAGTGFQSHLAGVLFTHRAGIQVLHVAYKVPGRCHWRDLRRIARDTRTRARLDGPRAGRTRARNRDGGRETIRPVARSADDQRERAARLRVRRLGRGPGAPRPARRNRHAALRDAHQSSRGPVHERRAEEGWRGAPIETAGRVLGADRQGLEGLWRGDSHRECEGGVESARAAQDTFRRGSIDRLDPTRDGDPQ